ncbi:hypothetical protein CBR_g29785 [Chara braunii]|uniref:Uncharacterized protein n=1 Tax=Chara braunii TaxID=69332 RepID=A0A388LBG9_CHABU|nr:hypothetical protein CBR_g29785 [Chara braunii]|eukprot:GBG79636.1 hypothetical protein CBR_g29785 [Chara braunii]
MATVAARCPVCPSSIFRSNDVASSSSPSSSSLDRDAGLRHRQTFPSCAGIPQRRRRSSHVEVSHRCPAGCSQLTAPGAGLGCFLKGLRRRGHAHAATPFVSFSGLRAINSPANRAGRGGRRRGGLAASGGDHGRVPRVSCAADAQVADRQSTSSSSFFGQERELSAPQSVVRDLPTPVRYLVCAALIGGAAGAGYALGRRVAPPAGQVAGVVVLGAVGAVAARSVNNSAKEVAAAELHNSLVRHPDITELRPEEIHAVADKYGVNPQDERFSAELKSLYDRFVTAAIPPGNEDLKGDEADKIFQFKNALGLQDPDASSVHMEIGRRIFRQRLETGDKDTAIEERRAFQKLVYVSTLVFGDASKFLLPWKRVFKVSDAQVEVAIRDNATRLFTVKLDEVDAEPDVENLRMLREEQLRLKLTDEVALDLFQSKARQRLEGHISRALEILKARTRVKDVRRVVTELESLLKYNSALAEVSRLEGLIPGVGPASLMGGDYDSDRAIVDLKQLYQTYLTEALTSGKLEDAKAANLTQLKNIFGMGNKETEELTGDITTKVYRRKLAAAVSDRTLEAAPSKAAYLQHLCDDLRFDPERAAKVHEEIYRQKLEACLEDNKLSDEDAKALLRLRVFLCVPEPVVTASQKELCGKIFSKVVEEALSGGVDGYDAEMRKKVKQTKEDLRLDTPAALEIAGKTVRAIFMGFVRRSRSMTTRKNSAKEIRKMIIFSNIVVTNLIADIKGEAEALEASTSSALSPEERGLKEKPQEEEEEEEIDEDDIEAMYAREQKKREKKDTRVERSQKEISLKDDMELREKLDLYKSFLMFCLQGDTTGMPMGTQIVTQKDTSDFARLAQLGDLLGLNALEVAGVHKGLAEQAFQSNVRTIMADGQLTPAKVEQLKALQKQLGLPDESAQKVIRTFTQSTMASTLREAVASGKLSVAEVKELKAAGVDVETMVPKEMRASIFKKHMESTFHSGTGEFDEKEMYETLPADLGLDVAQSKKMVQDYARERTRNALVTAVALLRQKKPTEAVASLNNLMACDKAVPATGALTWNVREELLDLYSIYLTRPSPDGDRSRLRELLGIEEGEAAALKDLVDSGGFTLESLEEEEFAF